MSNYSSETPEAEGTLASDEALQALRDGRLQPIGPMPPPDEAALRGWRGALAGALAAVLIAARWLTVAEPGPAH